MHFRLFVIIMPAMLCCSLFMEANAERVIPRPVDNGSTSPEAPSTNQTFGTGAADANCGPAPVEDPSKSPDANKREFLKWWDCIDRLSDYKGFTCSAICRVEDMFGGLTDHPMPTSEASDIMCNACKDAGPYPENVPNLPYRLQCLADQVRQFIGPSNTGFQDGQFNCNDYASVANEVLRHCGWQVYPSFRSACAKKPDGSDSGHQWLYIRTATSPPICYAYDPFNNIVLHVACK